MNSPLPWKVRYNHDRTNCFVESAPIPRRAYAQEVMGDDYFPELSREEDARLIVLTMEKNHEADRLLREVLRNTNLRHHLELTGLCQVIEEFVGRV